MKTLSKMIAAVVLVAFAVGVSASDAWLRDFAKAKENAKKDNKVIFAVFSGSDWCPPCMALEKNVLSKEEFVKGAEKSAVLLFVDYPRKKKLPDAERAQNEKLASAYKIEAFPTLIVMSADGKVLKRSSGAPGVDVKSIMAWLNSAIPAKK